jgi:hypothetical protein
MSISPETVYKNLKLLEQVDTSSSAWYRESAQETLADPEISLEWREAIADRLNDANHLLGVRTTGGNDSY